jgi:hypothetical protein
MQTYSITQYAIWVLSPVLLLAIAYIMHRTHQSRSFPAFQLYLLWVAFISYLNFALQEFSPNIQFYSYWITQAVSIGLSFVVLYEVFRNVLTEGTLPINKSNFVLINGILLLVAAAIALCLQGRDGNKFMYTILVLSRTARIVQVGLMLVLIALSLSFGFYWSSQAFGIALGFGFYASIELVNHTVRALLGPVGHQVWAWVSVLSYQCAAAIWIVYAAKGRKSPVMELPENKVSPCGLSR